MPNPEDVLRRVFVHIEQLAEDPPAYVREHDVDRYHELLDQLDLVGFDTEGFRFDKARDMFIHHHGGRAMRPDIFSRQVKALARYFEVRDKSVRFAGPQHDAR
jgi:hypothetical protein